MDGRYSAARRRTDGLPYPFIARKRERLRPHQLTGSQLCLSPFAGAIPFRSNCQGITPSAQAACTVTVIDPRRVDHQKILKQRQNQHIGRPANDTNHAFTPEQGPATRWVPMTSRSSGSRNRRADPKVVASGKAKNPAQDFLLDGVRKRFFWWS